MIVFYFSKVYAWLWVEVLPMITFRSIHRLTLFIVIIISRIVRTVQGDYNPLVQVTVKGDYNPSSKAMGLLNG